MTGIFDVPAGDLIEEVARELEKNPQAHQPAFAAFVKTGAHRERAPDQHNWWYMRLASILYRAYKTGSVGTERLRTYYGGRQARGVKPHHFKKSGGKIIRLGLQTLEKIGFVKKAKKGRVITPAGEKFLTQKAKETLAGLEEKRKNAKALAIERERNRREREAREKAATSTVDKRPEKAKETKKKQA